MSQKTPERSMSIQDVMANQQVYAEVLKEDLTAVQDSLINHKVSLRHSNRLNAALAETNQGLRDQAEVLTKNNQELKDSIKILEEKYKGTVWYLGNLSKQDVTPQFVAEVHELYLAHQDQMKRKENQNEVADVHSDAEQKRLDEKAAQGEAHNKVTRHEAGIKDEAVTNAQPAPIDVDSAIHAKEQIEREKKLFQEPEVVDVEIDVPTDGNAEPDLASALAPVPAAARKGSLSEQSQNHRRKQKQKGRGN